MFLGPPKTPRDERIASSRELEEEEESWKLLATTEEAESEDNNKPINGTKAQRELRPLGGFEHFFVKSSRLGMGIIYFIFDLKGPVSKDLLEFSLRMSVKKHPNLRARIVDDKMLESVPYNEYPFTIEIPVITKENALAYVERELVETKISTCRDHPLWSMALVHQEDKQQLAMICHHSILDGDSILLLIQEMMTSMDHIQFMSKSDRLALLEFIESMPFCDSQDAYLHDKGGLIPEANFLLSRVPWIAHPPVTPLFQTYTSSMHQRRSRIVSAQITGPLLKTLVARCKQEQTTVTAAIVISTIQQLGSYMSGNPHLFTETMCNFRDMVNERAPETKGGLNLFALPIDMLLQAKKEGNFWKAARNYKDELTGRVLKEDFIRELELFQLYKFLGEIFWKTMSSSIWTPVQGRVKATAISNLGVIDKKLQQVGPFQASRAQWGITEYGMGHYAFVAVSTQDGCLNLTVTFCEPLCSQERGHDLMQGIVSRLAKACDQEAVSYEEVKFSNSAPRVVAFA